MAIDIKRFNISDEMQRIILIFLLLILPLILIAVGLIMQIMSAAYFVTVISWFSIGVIFINALK
ncbi:MAG: hypothetical protein V5A68_05350 [Candidatus Thermoplasmatota archaeon]